MTLHLQKFVDRVRGHEARGAKDLVISMADAKDIHADLTRLLLELYDLREQRLTDPQEEKTVTVQISGGAF
jgi:hypothetical protein